MPNSHHIAHKMRNSSDDVLSWRRLGLNYGANPIWGNSYIIGQKLTINDLLEWEQKHYG